MVNRLRAWAWRHGVPGLHPSIEELLSWVDGNPTFPAHRALEAHLAGCRMCCEDANRLRDARNYWRELGSERQYHQTSLLKEGLRNLEASMRAWSALRGFLPESPRRHFLRNAVNLRSTRAVKLYFGQEAASRLARSAQQGAHEMHLLPAIKPLFNSFLGRRAADSVVRHIVRTV